MSGRMRVGAPIAVVGACAALFGASYAAAQLTGDNHRAHHTRATPAAPAPPTATGRELALTGAAELPSLRERPRPKPKPAAPPPPAPAAPRLVSRNITPAPRVKASPPSKPSPAPKTGQKQAAKPSPAPQQSAPSPTNFYDSGG